MQTIGGMRKGLSRKNGCKVLHQSCGGTLHKKLLSHRMNHTHVSCLPRALQHTLQHAQISVNLVLEFGQDLPCNPREGNTMKETFTHEPNCCADLVEQSPRTPHKRNK